MFLSVIDYNKLIYNDILYICMNGKKYAGTKLPFMTDNGPVSRNNCGRSEKSEKGKKPLRGTAAESGSGPGPGRFLSGRGYR